ncbi:hypothetical protein ACFQH9_07355 [Pseudonocardia lutea]|jgi:hypothetical protein|uniref:Uncharacterized protein n=1 Tax=Pseudonocardia lutea TaxID=2172015 RepID=A0ABW1I6U2_9PSEU
MPTDLSSVPSSATATAPARAATSAAPARTDRSATPLVDPDILRALESLHGDGVDA